MATLTYDLAVIGRRVVESELASLERRFAQHSATMTRIGNSAAAKGMRALEAPRNTRRSDPMLGPGQKEFAAAVRAREKAEIASSRTIAREKLRDERSLVSARNQLDRQRSRALYQQHTAEQAQAKRADALRAVAQAERVAFTRSIMGGAAGRVMGVVGAVGKAGLAATGITGAAVAASSVGQALRLDETSRRLSIASRAPGEEGVAPEVLRREFTNTAIATGLEPEAVATATQAFVAKTGDLATARANQQTLATVAQGADADPTAVFQAAADLNTKLGIKTAADMQQAFAILSQQGKKGSFELKGMASEFPEVLGSAATAGVRGIEGVRDIGAMMQIARDTSGSDSEASTAVNAMFRQLHAKSAKIQSGEAFGGRKVEVFEGGDPTKALKNFPTLLADTIEASRGNVVQLQEVFDVRGKKSIDPLITSYKNASRDVLKQGGSQKAAHEAGRQAIVDKFSNYRDIKADFSEVQRDAADAMRSPSVQLAVIMTQIKDAMAAQLLPELMKLIPQLAQLAPMVADVTASLVRFVSFVAENPWTGLGALVAGAIVMELGKAAIGSVVSSALSALIARSTIASTVSGAGAAGAGLGSLKGGLATAGAALGVGMAYDAASEFGQANGGWGGAGALFGVGTEGWGFDGVDNYLSTMAKQDAAVRDFNPAPIDRVPAGALPPAWALPQAPIDTGAVMAQLMALGDSASTAAQKLAKMQTADLQPNRTDKPSGDIKYFQ